MSQPSANQPQTKRLARELALQILFQTEFQSPVSLEDLLGLFEERVSADALQYTQMLVHGVNQHKETMDQLIQSVSQHWKVSRMSLVDRNIIRVAVFEMKYSHEPLKPQIAINEAVDIAKKYGTTDSGAFVNGVLDQISRGL
jgi:N utilization substance protein B